ncbi:MAG: ATP-binding protein, partial [Coriobacteriia bacterium]|nr:ATP-binding protein [Coriobacteriia bacterium]
DMPIRRRGSIRLWQTELFIVVIVVAILILSGSLSAGLKATLTRMTETSEQRNASALAQRLEGSLPLGVGGAAEVRDVLAEYRDIYGGGIWVYSAEGDLLASAFDTAPTAAVIESALLWGLDRKTPHVVSDLRAGGWIVASHPIGRSGRAPDGVVITASSADAPAAILRSVRDRLWVTFWVSLAIAGLLGFGFSELMSRRIRAMSDAAAAMAAGDFEQRISARLVPDEIQDLADSYNLMAYNLGEAFGELQESRRQIAAVVASMAEGVLAFDAEGRVHVVNPEAARLLAISAEDAPGSTVEEMTSEPGIIGAVHGGLAGRSTVETVSLGDRVALAHCTPLLGADDRVDGAVLLLADVTDQHRIEAAQRRFVADASHEMRTPIAAIKGMLELLDDGAKDVPDVRDDFLHTMQLEADRLSRLVADLLTLARLEAGSLELERTPVYVADLLSNVALVMRTLAEQASVELAVEPPDHEVRVEADRDRVVQVLLSFTDNALKHSPAGTTIHLRAAEQGDGTVRLSVSDEGPGIEPGQVDRVFERFYRADSARGGAGTGLGLAIAKEIVDAHGSAIEVSSVPGAGTSFGFSLPVV